MEASEYCLGTGVGFLQLDAPILQLVERNRLAGDGTTHEGTRTDDAIIAVEKAKLGFAGSKRDAFETIHDKDWAKKTGFVQDSPLPQAMPAFLTKFFVTSSSAEQASLSATLTATAFLFRSAAGRNRR